MIFSEVKMTDNHENFPMGNAPRPEEVEEAISSDYRSPAERLWDRVVHLGLGETTLRVGTAVVSVLLVLFVV